MSGTQRSSRRAHTTTGRAGHRHQSSIELFLGYLLALAAGLLASLAYEWPNWWWASIAGVGVLAGLIRRRTLLTSWGLALTWSLAFFFPMVRWAGIAAGTPAAWIALAGLQAFLASLIAPALALACPPRWREASILTWPTIFAACWVMIEYLRATFPYGGMPWGIIAYSQDSSPLLRLARIGGQTLVSFLAVWLAVTIMSAISLGRTRRRTHNPPARDSRRNTPPAHSVLLPRIAALVATIAIVAAAGLTPVPTGAEAGHVTIAAVQGTSEQREGLGRAYSVFVNHAHATTDAFTSGALKEADLIVWPESSTDIDPRSDERVGRELRELIASVSLPLILVTNGWREDYRTVDAVGYTADGAASATYSKSHPVPFGEYIPHRDFFARLSSAVEQVHTDVRAGQGPALMRLPRADASGKELAVAVPICFEIAYTNILRDAINVGAQVIVVPTNNASFGQSSESFQQLQITRFRAVETGRSIMAVSTVGYTAAIAPNGVVIDTLPTWEAGTLTSRLPLRTEITPAMRMHDLWAYAAWIPGLILVFAGGLVQLRQRAATGSRTRQASRPAKARRQKR